MFDRIWLLNRLLVAPLASIRLFSLSDFIVSQSLLQAAVIVTAAAFWGLGYQMQLVWVRSR